MNEGLQRQQRQQLRTQKSTAKDFINPQPPTTCPFAHDHAHAFAFAHAHTHAHAHNHAHTFAHAFAHAHAGLSDVLVVATTVGVINGVSCQDAQKQRPRRPLFLG